MFLKFLSNEKTHINAVQFSISNCKLKNENWKASCRDRVNRSSIKDDGNWLTLNLQWIQAAAHKIMSIYMLLNKPCMLLNKPYKFYWSQERLVWEIIWEIWMRRNRLIFTLVTLGNRVDKTLRMSQVTVERLAMVFKASTILLIRYFWFKNTFL